MFCPACGEDAGDDERCPSCDADLSAFRAAASDAGDPARPAAAGTKTPAAPVSAPRSAAAAECCGAAAEVYAGAWERQPGDPNVGTDWATSLFYSGDIDAAIERVDAVLAADPQFQSAYYNRGNYLGHRALVLDEGGGSAGAAQARKQAEAAFRTAVQIDPGSDVGKAAAERLQSVSGDR